MTIAIVIADDEPVVVAGLEAVLLRNNFHVVACTNDTDTLVHTLAEVECDVLVAGMWMPDGDHPDGLALIQRIRESHPQLGIVVLTHVVHPAELRLLLDAGVSALFDRRASMRDIPLAVHAASVGRAFLSPAIRRALAALDRARARGDRKVALTRRELDVLRAYSQGLSLLDISQQMARSVKTISRQKRSAMAKLGLENDAQFYQYLINVRAGLVDCFNVAG
jgi:two-component system capsular synthesis response regulator RcsB